MMLKKVFSHGNMFIYIIAYIQISKALPFKSDPKYIYRMRVNIKGLTHKVCLNRVTVLRVIKVWN